MKTVRCLLPLLLSLTTAAFAQSDAKHSDMKHSDAKQSDAKQSDAQQTDAKQSDAKQSFARLKSLAGTWDGPVTTTPEVPEMKDISMHVTLRVTSMGNVLMHEMTNPKRPDDPITMLYLDGDQLQLTHFCDAGNRPRMNGKLSEDGKRIEFEFVDVTGPMKYGHMHNAVFTFIDDDRHSEDWTFMLPGNRTVRAHCDLRRAR